MCCNSETSETGHKYVLIVVPPYAPASTGIMCSAEPTIKEPGTEALEHGQNMPQEAV